MMRGRGCHCFHPVRECTKCCNCLRLWFSVAGEKTQRCFGQRQIGGDCDFSMKINASPLRFGCRQGRLRQKIAAIGDCNFWSSQVRFETLLWPGCGISRAMVLTFYDVLRVKPSASPLELKTAYKRRVLEVSHWALLPGSSHPYFVWGGGGEAARITTKDTRTSLSLSLSRSLALSLYIYIYIVELKAGPRFGVL